MQTLKHKYKNIHRIFDDIERFYKVVSEKQHTYKSLFDVNVFDSSFKYLVELFEEFGHINIDFKFIEENYEKLRSPKFDTKNIIVCFSGGKDSLAAALHYKQRGYNVYLYHTSNINHVNETDTAKELAKWLDMPIHIEHVEIEGKRDWIEHPMKNIMIANGALNWGILNNITTKIAFGNFYTSDIEEEQFDLSGDDTIDMWIAYEDIIKRIIPRFKMYIGLKNLETSFNLVYKPENKVIFDDIYSCVGAHRFNKYNHNRIKNKYGLELWKNRCGCCWKCAYEYIWTTDHDLQEYNEEYYGYCLNILAKTLKKEQSIVYNNTNELWKAWFFYSIKKSKFL